MNDAMDEMQNILTLPPASETAHSRKNVERIIADIKKKINDSFISLWIPRTSPDWCLSRRERK